MQILPVLIEPTRPYRCTTSEEPVALPLLYPVWVFRYEKGIILVFMEKRKRKHVNS